jgi:uncharacterized protein
VLRDWRWWVLLILLAGPFAAYLGFGALWLRDHGWLLYAGLIWVATGILATILAARWTKSSTTILPPIDWDAPQTFAKIDRDAWEIVEHEAEESESISIERLTEFELYIATGLRLAKALAEHYHPLTTEPIESVAVVDVLTALELAAEDLARLCRQVPGGDMITPSHWKKAVTVAGYFQRANDMYSYLLPIFSPVTGLMRLGTQQWMVKPAWKEMQKNLLRWFFHAYVNRLGAHLIELYSGRLTIGAHQYRKLTGRAATTAAMNGELPSVRIAVAGARGAGKSRLLTLLQEARTGDVSLLKARLESTGLDQNALDHLKDAEWVEIPGYSPTLSESSRDGTSMSFALQRAVDADLLVLVVDARRDTQLADTAFAHAWDRWFVEHPNSELPPALAVLTGMDHPELGGPWMPPYDWSSGHGPRETAGRARLNALRVSLPPSITEIIPVGLPADTPFGVAELVLPSVLLLLHRAERSALIRHFRRLSSRSKAARLATQVGRQVGSLWSQMRTARKGRKKAGA